VTAEGLRHFPGCGWGSPWAAEGGNREGALFPGHSGARSDQTVSPGTTEETLAKPLLFAPEVRMALEHRLEE